MYILLCLCTVLLLIEGSTVPIYGQAGQSFQLDCGSGSSLSTNFSWSYSPLPTSSSPHRLFSTLYPPAGHPQFPGVTFTTFGSVLIIANLSKSDEGRYHCHAVRETEVKIEDFDLLLRESHSPNCHADPPSPWPQCKEGPSASGEETLSAALTHLALRLYNLASTRHWDNLFFSPVSITRALAHLLLGARGHTRSVLERALSLPQDFYCIHEKMRRLEGELGKSFMSDSRIYYTPELILHDFFINQTQEFYEGAPEPLTEVNVKLINDWASKKTNGQITHLLHSVPKNTQLLLLDIAHYNGQWQEGFELSETKVGEFIAMGGVRVHVPLMNSIVHNITLQRSEHFQAQVARLPLSDGVSALFLLPLSASLASLREVEQGLTGDGGATALRKLAVSMVTADPQVAKVVLPRLSLEWESDSKLLRSLGLEDLFNIPNLCAVSSSYPLSLSDAQHHATLSFSEEGVEGGATSSLSFARSLPHFSALHPFILVLWSEGAGAPMFIGRVADPSQGQDRGSVV
ncbi:IC1 inhibitor, partial [Amia calva]|nr:IC1 inhibitor [Amia calva]